MGQLGGAVGYAALATDYDGTIATEGVVPESTYDALERVRGSGRKLVLVTGRALEDLLRIAPCMDLFHRVVAENGAHLYQPATGEDRLLGERPPDDLVQALGRVDERLYVGRVVLATSRSNDAAVHEIIEALGLGPHLSVIVNKGGVMILPAGVDKASGLEAALGELGISPLDTVAVGDAENDHHLLDRCGCAVAVANALPAVKERADWVTSKPEGAGVEELIEHLLDGDLRFITPARRMAPRPTRNN